MEKENKPQGIWEGGIQEVMRQKIRDQSKKHYKGILKKSKWMITYETVGRSKKSMSVIKQNLIKYTLCLMLKDEKINEYREARALAM